MTSDTRAFDTKFRVPELLLRETQGWALSVRPGQTTLGAMVLSIRSGKRDLAELSPAESAGMGLGFGLAEDLAREVFGAVRLNLLCLMMQDPIVHFHILPRYAEPVTRYGRTWVDSDWPGPPAINADTPDTQTLKAIQHDLLSGTALLKTTSQGSETP